jgi:pilus assembly protein FimV
MLIPAAVHALGLGNIVMNSALNQPLDAEIELLSVQSGDLDNLAVSLGSTEDFARVGADRAFFLTKIVFSVEKKANGTPYIKLVTTDRVTEPFLDFVVEARWPRGRILREFTVLVDPPVLTEEAPAPIQQPATQAAPAPQPITAAPAMKAAPATARPAPIPERAQLTPVMKRNGEMSYGPVKRNDTLWEIANRMRPDESVSVNQMMIALVRNNPNAFYNGNVNQLKAGYVLRIEDPSAVAAVSVADADAAVEQQRVEWQARKSGRLVAQVAAPEGRIAGEGAPAGSAADQARLKLVAPGREGAGSGAGEAEVNQLRQDLLIAAEALDANRQETEELKTRLAEMDEQLQAMQRLIMLKDDEMLALQQQLGAKPAEPAQVPPAVAEEAPAEAPAAEPKPAAPAPVVAEEEPGLFESPLLMYGAAGLLIAALVGWMVVRRRKMQEGFQESILNVEGGAAAGVTPAAGGESSMVSDFAMSEMSDMEGIHAESAEVDPISEADVYLAYGRHQQAEDILREAMVKTPDRHELKLKMLEVYFAAKNRNAFEKQAEELHTALGNESDPLWAKAVTMGHQLCPDNELFGGVSVDTLKEKLGGEVSAAEEDLLDFDFDLDSSELAGGTETEAVEELDFESELESAMASEADQGLDFDMDFESPGKPAATKTEAKPSAGRAENALDFDVSSLDFNLDQVEQEAKSTEKHGAIDFDMGSLETAAEPAAEETAPEIDLGDLTFDEGEAAVSEESTVGAGLEEASLGETLGEDLGADIFGEVDEVGTKLDLAKAYVDMGDSEGARSILGEVLEEGNDSQKQQARELMAQIH